MKNMDKGLAVPKWVLIVWPKIPQMAPKFTCPSPKVWDFNKKRLHWASVVRGEDNEFKKGMFLQTDILSNCHNLYSKILFLLRGGRGRNGILFT